MQDVSDIYGNNKMVMYMYLKMSFIYWYFFRLILDQEEYFRVRNFLWLSIFGRFLGFPTVILILSLYPRIPPGFRSQWMHDLHTTTIEVDVDKEKNPSLLRIYETNMGLDNTIAVPAAACRQITCKQSTNSSLSQLLKLRINREDLS